MLTKNQKIRTKTEVYPLSKNKAGAND